MYCVVGTKIYDPVPNKDGVHLRFDLIRSESGELYLKRTDTGLKKMPVQSTRCTLQEIKAQLGSTAIKQPAESPELSK